MAREGTQKKLERVRPPRVNISYDVETGGAIETKELPFLMGVLADLSGNPKEALPRLKDRKFVEITPDNFDAVLTDEAMPGMTGSELARAIRARRPDIPILMMSGHVGQGLEQRARDAGVSELLHKPLTAAELARGLARVLHASGGTGVRA